MLMRWRQLQNERCSVARTMSVIGDRWTMLIVRDCFLGVRRFEVFQQRLAITRHILADRLRKLVKKGVLRKVAYQQRPLRYEYRLSERAWRSFPCSWLSSIGETSIWRGRRAARSFMSTRPAAIVSTR